MNIKGEGERMCVCVGGGWVGKGGYEIHICHHEITFRSASIPMVSEKYYLFTILLKK